MSNIILTNHTCSPMTIISNTFLDYYLPSASSDALKVYLLLLRYANAGQSISLNELAHKLNQSEKTITTALEYWETLSLLHTTKDQDGLILSIQLLPVPLKTKDEISEDVKESSIVLSKPSKHSTIMIPEKKIISPSELEQNSSEQLSQLIYVAGVYIGKNLSSSDLNTLFYIYDTLKLSSDLIVFLIEHCVSLNKKSFRYIESVAIAWYEAGFTTVDEAKASIKTHNKNYYSIMKTFGLSGRNPGKVEIEYIDKWMETYGFSLPIILEACNRTLKSIQQPSFPYADRILSDWKKANAMTMEQITKLDNHYQEKKKEQPKSNSPVKNNQVQNQFHNFEQRSYNYQDLERRFIHKTNRIEKGES